MKLRRNISALCLLIFCALTAHSQTAPVADAKFRKCLADSIPSVLDASQNLILSQAAGVTVLECPNYGIVSVNELPYFTNLTELNITKNPVASLPDISGLTSLTRLNIGETSITSLPDFSDFPNLIHLSVHRLNLTQFPDVSANSKLKELFVHTNNFSSVPALNLPDLEVLAVSLTKITSLPNLSNLTKLKRLECFRNPIKQLPDLSTLASLKIVDASSCLIEQFPSLPVGVTTIRLDSNMLTSIPDMSVFTAATNVRLYKNYLSFEDLLPLASLPNFSAYELAPMKNFPVSTNMTIIEPSGFTLDSKIDSNLSGVSRKWYFNNSLTTQTGRYFSLTSASPANQGIYRAELTHPSLPGITLRTDNFTITVLPCVNLNGITLDIHGSTCMKQGSIKVNMSNQPGSNYTFELKGMKSQKIVSNTTGQFSNLSEPSYTLTIDAMNGCAYPLPDPVLVPLENCKQIVLTPNGDNVDDTYYFPQTGTCKVIDKWGNVVHQLTLPVLWDGYVNGSKIPVGYYLLNINNGEEVLKLSVIH